MSNLFLKIENSLIDMANQKKLTLTDVMILAKITEFERNGYDCYMTDEQLAYICLCSTKTVSRALAKLEQMQLIQRITKTVSNQGKVSKQRILKLNNGQNVPNLDKEQTFCPKATDNLSMEYGQNDLIKDNVKNNIKKETIFQTKEFRF